MRFADRQQAGKLLAQKLEGMELHNCVVVGIPRGGMVVAKEVARQLKCPLTAIITRKITSPYNKEYAIGAVNESGDIVGDEREFLEAGEEWLESEIQRQQEEIQRRKKLYGLDKSPIRLFGKTVIIIDDGIATGHTMQAAVLEIRKLNPKKLIVAAPVIPESTYDMFAKEAGVVTLCIPSVREDLGAVSSYYTVFPQVEDNEVIEMMSI